MTDPDDMEDVYKRAEKAGIQDESSLMDWMKEDQNGEVVRQETSKLKQFVKDVAEPWNLDKELDKAKTSSDLDGFEDKIDNIQMSVKNKKEQLKDKFEKKVTQLIDDEIDALPDDDVKAVKSTIKKYKSSNPNIVITNQDRFQNYAFNAARREIQKAQRDNNPNRLRSLKDDVSGLQDENELVSEIQGYLDKLEAR